MKNNIHLLFTACCTAGFLCTNVTNGQNAQPEPGLKKTNTIHDKSFYDAWHVIQKAAEGTPSKIPKDSPDYVPDRRTTAERLDKPEVSAAILTVLNKVDSDGLDQLQAEGGHELALMGIRAAVLTSKSKFIPVLKRLAHKSDPLVRDVLADREAHRKSPSPSVELLKECLLGALEYAPKEYVRTADANQWVVDREPFERVENCLRLYCEFATPKQREDVRPFIEKYLSKYNNAEFEKIYRPKLEKLLKIGRERLTIPQGEAEATEPRPEK